MDERPRIVGVDFGTKHVGIALADPFRMFAQPDGTYSPDEAIRRIEEIRNTSGLETLVVGWPLTVNGEEGETTRLVQIYINRLQKRLDGVEIVKWDERYSSQQARRALLEAGRRRKARRSKDLINAAAAAVILQEYLDEVSGKWKVVSRHPVTTFVPGDG